MKAENTCLSFWLTKSEAISLRALAKKKDYSVSAFVKHVVLDRIRVEKEEIANKAKTY